MVANLSSRSRLPARTMASSKQGLRLRIFPPRPEEDELRAPWEALPAELVQCVCRHLPLRTLFVLSFLDRLVEGHRWAAVAHELLVKQLRPTNDGEQLETIVQGLRPWPGVCSRAAAKLLSETVVLKTAAGHDYAYKLASSMLNGSAGDATLGMWLACNYVNRAGTASSQALYIISNIARCSYRTARDFDLDAWIVAHHAEFHRQEDALDLYIALVYRNGTTRPFLSVPILRLLGELANPARASAARHLVLNHILSANPRKPDGAARIAAYWTLLGPRWRPIIRAPVCEAYQKKAPDDISFVTALPGFLSANDDDNRDGLLGTGLPRFALADGSTSIGETLSAHWCDFTDAEVEAIGRCKPILKIHLGRIAGLFNACPRVALIKGPKYTRNVFLERDLLATGVLSDTATNFIHNIGNKPFKKRQRT